MSIANASHWSIVFYVNPDGEDPVREFLRGLDWKAEARFDWSIEQLHVRNVQARPPLVRHLESKIWELREESQTNIYRLLYCFLSGQRVLFLHGFQKKTQKTPRREIEIATQRLEIFMQQEGGE